MMDTADTRSTTADASTGASPTGEDTPAAQRAPDSPGAPGPGDKRLCSTSWSRQSARPSPRA
jgi:hypothetical protein